MFNEEGEQARPQAKSVEAASMLATSAALMPHMGQEWPAPHDQLPELDDMPSAPHAQKLDFWVAHAHGDEESGVPQQSLRIRLTNERPEMPEKQPELPEQQGLPNEQQDLPDKQQELPNEQQDLPKEQEGLPNEQQEELPDEQQEGAHPHSRPVEMLAAAGDPLEMLPLAHDDPGFDGDPGDDVDARLDESRATPGYQQKPDPADDPVTVTSKDPQASPASAKDSQTTESELLDAERSKGAPRDHGKSSQARSEPDKDHTPTKQDAQSPSGKVREEDDDDSSSSSSDAPDPEDLPLDYWEWMGPGESKMARADKIALSLFGSKDSKKKEKKSREKLPDGGDGGTSKAPTGDQEKAEGQDKTRQKDSKADGSDH